MRLFPITFIILINFNLIYAFELTELKKPTTSAWAEMLVIESINGKIYQGITGEEHIKEAPFTISNNGIFTYIKSHKNWSEVIFNNDEAGQLLKLLKNYDFKKDYEKGPMGKILFKTNNSNTRRTDYGIEVYAYKKEMYFRIVPDTDLTLVYTLNHEGIKKLIIALQVSINRTNAHSEKLDPGGKMRKQWKEHDLKAKEYKKKQELAKKKQLEDLKAKAAKELEEAKKKAAQDLSINKNNEKDN